VIKRPDRSILLTLIAVITIFAYSCKKEPDEVGASIIPESNILKLGFTDTASLKAYSRLVDSVRSDETIVNLLGSYTDPVFGRVTTSFYSQFRLPVTNYDFGSNPQPDSLVLSMKYAGYYGDTNLPQSIHVYEMSQAIFRDSVYFSNQNLPNYGTDFANYSFYPRPRTSLITADDTLAPQIRINLSKYSFELANKILNADSIDLSDNEQFLEYFHGLYIEAEPNPNQASILYLDMMNVLSNLTLYYHNDSSDSLYLVLNVNENAARFGHFNHHGYQQADQDFKNQLLYNDTSLGKQQLYLQTMGGVVSTIEIPYIYNWFENQQKVLVNEARLIMTPYDDQSDLYTKPSSLSLLKLNEEGNSEFLEDQFEGEGYFGGAYDSASNSYYFRITKYVQDLMMGRQEDYGLSLYISGVSVRAERLWLYGTEPADTSKRLRLELRYTLLE